jgi:quinoprotein glucose dehydrogenase
MPNPYAVLAASKRRELLRVARNRFCQVLVLVSTVACTAATQVHAWEYWGGDPGGMRFSSAAQITPTNVDKLVRAWEFRTGDLENRPPAAMARSKFEATPLLVEDSLVFCTPFNEVIAVDPGTGLQK